MNQTLYGRSKDSKTGRSRLFHFIPAKLIIWCDPGIPSTLCNVKASKRCRWNEENKSHIPCASAPMCIDWPSVFALRRVKHISWRSCERGPRQRNVMLAIQVGTTFFEKKKNNLCDIHTYTPHKTNLINNMPNVTNLLSPLSVFLSVFLSFFFCRGGDGHS